MCTTIEVKDGKQKNHDDETLDHDDETFDNYHFTNRSNASLLQAGPLAVGRTRF